MSHIPYPDIESEDFKTLEKGVRQAVRLLLKEGHPFEPIALMKRQEVAYALGTAQIPLDLIRLMMTPNGDTRDWIWDEYAERKLWSLNEAASLSVGLDPFMYNFEPGQFYPGWRERREHSELRAQDAILLEELKAKKTDGVFYIQPIDFCKWALEEGLLTSHLTEPMKALALSKIESYVPTLESMREQFINYAQQRLFAEGLTTSELRRRALYGFAIFVKYDNPKLKIPDISKLAFNSLSKDCQEIKNDGFALDAIRSDLYKFDRLLNSTDKASDNFLNIAPSDIEILSTDPTHRWWNRWKPVIAQELPYITLPV